MFEKTTKKSLDKPTSSKFFHMMIPHFQDELVPQSHLCGEIPQSCYTSKEPSFLWLQT